MATTTGSTEAPLRGSSGQIFDLEPPRAAQKSRFPEIALGLLLIVGGALAALVWQISANRTTAVLATVNEVAQGDVVELEDLQLVQIRSIEDVNVMRADQSGEVVGRVARTDLAPGTLLTPQHVTDGSTVDLGDGVVGLSLEPGRFPSMRLKIGDVVSVVLTPGQGEIDAFDASPSVALAEVESRVLVERAVVGEVLPLANQGGLFIALTMSEAEAAVTTRAAAQDRVSLIEVAEGRG